MNESILANINSLRLDYLGKEKHLSDLYSLEHTASTSSTNESDVILAVWERIEEVLSEMKDINIKILKFKEKV